MKQGIINLFLQVVSMKIIHNKKVSSNDVRYTNYVQLQKTSFPYMKYKFFLNLLFIYFTFLLSSSLRQYNVII